MKRIVLALIVAALFTWAVIETESWFWIGIECLTFHFISGIVIAIDTAHEYKNQ